RCYRHVPGTLPRSGSTAPARKLDPPAGASIARFRCHQFPGHRQTPRSISSSQSPPVWRERFGRIWRGLAMASDKPSLSEKATAILEMIARGHNYEQILSAYPIFTYKDIFEAAEEALKLSTKPKV